MSIEEPPWLFSESTWIQQGKPSGQVQEKAQKAVTYQDVQSLMSGYSDRQRIRGLLRNGQKISAITAPLHGGGKKYRIACTFGNARAALAAEPLR
jgi:hypothetical protein